MSCYIHQLSLIAPTLVTDTDLELAEVLCTAFHYSACRIVAPPTPIPAWVKLNFMGRASLCVSRSEKRLILVTLKRYSKEYFIVAITLCELILEIIIMNCR